MNELARRNRQQQKTLLKAAFLLTASVEAEIAHGTQDEAMRSAVAELRDYVGTLQKTPRLDGVGPEFMDEELNAFTEQLDARVSALESRFECNNVALNSR